MNTTKEKSAKKPVRRVKRARADKKVSGSVAQIAQEAFVHRGQRVAPKGGPVPCSQCFGDGEVGENGLLVQAAEPLLVDTAVMPALLGALCALETAGTKNSGVYTNGRPNYEPSCLGCGSSPVPRTHLSGCWVNVLLNRAGVTKTTDRALLRKKFHKGEL